MSRTREEGRKETGRAERIPLGVRRQRLEAPQRAGFVRRWVNDWPGRLVAAKSAGYSFVYIEAEEEGSRRSETVGVNEDGSPLLAYLMEIKESFYRQDQEAKENDIAAQESTISRGATQGPVDAKDQGNFYVGSEHRGIRKADHI